MTGQEKQGKAVPPVKRDKKGRLLPGSTANRGGRPRGIDFRKMLETEARKRGTSVRAVFGRVVFGMVRAAEEGDAAAAKLIIDRLCGSLDKAPQINVDARSVTIGPTMPPVREAAAMLLQIHDTAKHVLGITDVDDDAGSNGKNGTKKEE